MPYIYRFVFNNGKEYVGKLTDDKILEAHTKKWYCQDSPEHQSAWEKQWESEVNRVGMANQTFVREVYYWELSTVVNSLKNTGLPISFLDGLMQLWGKEQLEVVEALLILLSKKSGQNIGQQIDFLAEYTNVEDYVSVAEFERRKTRFFDSLINGIYLNFKNRKNPIIDEMSDYISDLLDKASLKTTSREGTVNLTKYPEVARAITLHITKATVADIERQMRSKVTNENKVFLEPYIDDLVKELNNQSYTKSGNLRKKNNQTLTYGNLFSSIYNFITENKKEVLSNDAEAESRQAASDFLTQWLQKTSLSSILSGGTLKTPDTDTGWQKFVKTRFSKYISNILDKAIPYEPSYSDRGGWLEQKIKTNGDQWGLSQYYDWLNTAADTKDYIPSERSSLMEQSTPKQVSTFIIDCWAPIYAEQIVLWLKEKHPESFLLQRRDLVDGYKRDINSSNEIEYY